LATSWPQFQNWAICLISSGPSAPLHNFTFFSETQFPFFTVFTNLKQTTKASLIVLPFPVISELYLPFTSAPYYLEAPKEVESAKKHPGKPREILHGLSKNFKLVDFFRK
jgi:hypothetical protein